MSYLILAGHDQPLEDLLPVVGQCSSIGLQYTRRQFAASGIVVDELPFIELNFSTLNITRYQALLTQTGLLVATTGPVSVYIPDQNFNWILRNGTAVKPEIGTDGQRTNYWLKDFTFLVKSLQAQA